MSIKTEIMMSKKAKLKCIIPSVLLFLNTGLFAQHAELTAYGGYTFDHTLNSYSTNYYKAKIAGSGHLGGALDFFLNENYSLSLTYSFQPTTGYLYGSGSTANKSDGLDLHYILLGGNRYVGNNRVKGYGGLGLGACIIAPKTYSGATKFAWDIHLGVKLYASDRVGIRLQAQLLSLVDGAGFGIGIGTGGAGAGISTYSSVLQFGLNGGLIIKFKK
jgi:hypothetical protein